MENEAFYREQKEAFIFESFDRGDAYYLGNYISKKFVEDDISAAVYIELNKQPIYQFFANGTSLSDLEWIHKKIRCVDYFQESSAAIHAACLEKGRDPKKYYMDKGIAALAGAFPITVKGSGIIGAVAVSGFDDSFDDHNIIIEGLSYLMGLKNGNI